MVAFVPIAMPRMVAFVAVFTPFQPALILALMPFFACLRTSCTHLESRVYAALCLALMSATFSWVSLSCHHSSNRIQPFFIVCMHHHTLFSKLH